MTDRPARIGHFSVLGEQPRRVKPAPNASIIPRAGKEDPRAGPGIRIPVRPGPVAFVPGNYSERMMSTIQAVYFDSDRTDPRADVLRAAGYELEECCSLIQLAQRLKANQSTEVVFVADTWDKPAEGALALARGLSVAPIVLFGCRSSLHPSLLVDLEVEPLRSPRGMVS